MGRYVLKKIQNQEVLTEEGGIKQELVRSLFHTLEIWETTRRFIAIS